MQTERLKKVLDTVQEPAVKGSELAWVFRCRGCQSCGFDTSGYPHWIGLDLIPNSQVGEPLEGISDATTRSS